MRPTLLPVLLGIGLSINTVAAAVLHVTTNGNDYLPTEAR